MSAQKPKDPNWVCTFELVRNPDKKEDKHPDFVHPPAKDKETGQVKLNKAGKPMKKNLLLAKISGTRLAVISKRIKASK